MGKFVLCGVVLAVGLFLWKILGKAAITQAEDNEPGMAGVLNVISRVMFGCSFGIPALIVFFSTIVVVPAGHVGVATYFGEVQPHYLAEGLSIINPLFDVTKMSVQVQKAEKKYDAASKDLQAVHVSMVLNYHLLPDQAPRIYQSVGVNYADVIIDPAAQEVLKANTALHNASEILHQRPQIKSDVQEGLHLWLKKYGIELKEAALANIKFDESYQKAIEAKQIEEQKAAQKQYELLQAKLNAEIAAANAKGEGDAARERARGEADATRTRGDAEFYYNEKVTSSLTDLLIKQQYLQRWDGKLPVYMLGEGGSGVLLQLPAEGAQKTR